MSSQTLTGPRIVILNGAEAGSEALELTARELKEGRVPAGIGRLRGPIAFTEQLS